MWNTVKRVVTLSSFFLFRTSVNCEVKPRPFINQYIIGLIWNIKKIVSFSLWQNKSTKQEYNVKVGGGGDLLCVRLHHDVAVDEDGADDGEWEEWMSENMNGNPGQTENSQPQSVSPGSKSYLLIGWKGDSKYKAFSAENLKIAPPLLMTMKVFLSA